MMFQSQSVNEISFSLQQVLGSLNTIPDSQSHVPKEVFKKQDLMNKRYFLTSYPLPNVRKRKQRWSIKYNKYVDDKPKTKEELIQEQKELNSSTLIKSFEVQLFANNTFTTIKGLGDMTLRGKWWIIGNDLINYGCRFGYLVLDVPFQDRPLVKGQHSRRRMKLGIGVKYTKWGKKENHQSLPQMIRKIVRQQELKSMEV